ncbi:ATP-binding protein [Hyphomonas atlantica corrig.]|uniref:hypothetical protein n=1 Tax=Hyphomonas atlantica TaxID=1280948 RepID=UPI002352279B|nr:hypothetical protein [Hyphomonas atlantica]
MPSLSQNVKNRVRKLPKPSNSAQALQPLFEAVSNALYAIEDKVEMDEYFKGEVVVRVDGLSKPKNVRIEVSDDGIGLDKVRFAAFCELDTAFKRKKGGKGVGRLFWLDAFDRIKVESAYTEQDSLKNRAFSFRLSESDQIVPSDEFETDKAKGATGTSIVFHGLKSGPYTDQFPKKTDTFLRYFSSHFIADFLMGKSPKVTVVLNGEAHEYPASISELVVGERLEAPSTKSEEYGTLNITGFKCRPSASAGLEGRHQLHLLANGRTVETRKIDNLLGLFGIQDGEHDDLVFHGCISGEYLDERVNEGRTAFNIPEKKLKEICRYCADIVKSELLQDSIAEYAEERRKSYEKFVREHPIYGFDETEVQLERVPFHAMSAEDFAAGLVKYQIRREEERQQAIEQVIKSIEHLENIPSDFQDTVIKAAADIQRSEQLALAQHVVRRKLVLELLDKLIKRLRKIPSTEGKDRQDRHQLESTLHSFICPMFVRGDDPNERRSRAHDLWIVDERFAFTRAFSSDKRLDALISDGGSADRPDLALWDLAFGMGVANDQSEEVDLSEPLRKMMIVEFKHPGRKEYPKPEDQIEQQITKYLAQLKNSELESFDRDRIRIADDCIFYCYVVADIVGDLRTQLSSWETTANQQGRIRPLKGDYRGSIEVVQWRDLVNDAWQRNAATMLAAGLKRHNSTMA